MRKGSSAVWGLNAADAGDALSLGCGEARDEGGVLRTGWRIFKNIRSVYCRMVRIEVDHGQSVEGDAWLVVEVGRSQTVGPERWNYAERMGMVTVENGRTGSFVISSACRRARRWGVSEVRNDDDDGR